MAIVLFALTAAPASGRPVPLRAPAGFTWKEIGSIKAAFLVPNGWHFREEEKPGAHDFFISELDNAKGGEFRTGLTVHVQTLKTESAPKRAATLLVTLTRDNQVQKTWQSQEGPLQLFGARMRVATEQPPSIEQVLVIGNGRTNALYLIIFESPEPLWTEAWKKGEVMLKDFRLDDDF